MVNPVNELSGVVRSSKGKGPARRLRQANLLPAIVYGKGAPAMSVAVSPKETSKLLLTPLRRNIMIHLNLQDEKGSAEIMKTVMVRDLQIDPVRRSLLHVDFVEVNPKEAVVASVPVLLFGKSKSVVAGGQLDQVSRSLRIRTLPGAIPEKIELDVTELPFGATHANQITLPSGIELADAAETTILTIRMPRDSKDDEAAAGAAAPVAGAAPAAGAAAPAAAPAADAKKKG